MPAALRNARRKRASAERAVRSALHFEKMIAQEKTEKINRMASTAIVSGPPWPTISQMLICSSSAGVSAKRSPKLKSNIRTRPGLQKTGMSIPSRVSWYRRTGLECTGAYGAGGADLGGGRFSGCFNRIGRRRDHHAGHGAAVGD